MKTGATLSVSSRVSWAALLALALAAAPAVAEEQKPVTDKSIDAKDVATTPLRDVNLSRDPIPQLLQDLRENPYDTEGLKRCSHYIAAVRELDAILGVDFDIATPEQRRISVGRVAQSLVGSLIPFRGVVREVSGAAKHERDFQEAILAGMMRRAFLKGMGLKLGCTWPARPANEATRERVLAEIEEAAG